MLDGPPPSAPPEDLATRKRVIEEQLLEGLDSGPPVEVNEAFWQERRRLLQERIAARSKAGGS